MSTEPDGGAVPEAGWVSGALRDELPGLALRYLLIDRGSGSSPRHVRKRLGELSNRFSGAQVINLRHQAIPWAYRVFFRHVGLDPDADRTPVEAIALERMKHGGFKSENLLDDALTIAVVESGVAMRAFDADRLQGRLGIRASAPGETLAGRTAELPAETLVIADDTRPVGFLFGPTSTDHVVTSKTRRTALVAIQVKGVPDISVEEALPDGVRQRGAVLAG